MKLSVYIFLFFLIQSSYTQDISVTIDLEKNTFTYLEDIFPQITIQNNSDNYFLFSSYRSSKPYIYFELYDTNNKEIELLRESESNYGHPFYFAILPNRSVSFPLSGYYYFPRITGGRHIKPGKYKVRGIFTYANLSRKKHYSNWFNFEILNPSDTVLTNKYLEAEELLFF